MSFSDELPYPTAELVEKEWKQRLRSSARLSVDLLKMKQQPYDRRASSTDAMNWYSAGSSFSGASVTGGAAQPSSNYYAAPGARSSFIGSSSMMSEDEEDRSEVTYSPNRLSIILSGPSAACGGGHGYGSSSCDRFRTQSDSAATYGYACNSFQPSLIEKLYGYEEENVSMTASPLDAPPRAQETLLGVPGHHHHPRNTSVFRSFEGWGFDADELHLMDPIEERENENEPFQQQVPQQPSRPFRFDSSIVKAAYDPDVAMADVDPLDLMDTSRSFVESHPVPIPARPSRMKSSQVLTREQYIRKHRNLSLQSLQGQGPQSRQHSQQYNGRSGHTSVSNGEGYTTSPYRPSIVLSEIQIFDLSESEPPNRNVSLTGSNRGSIFGKRGSARGGSVSKLSKKSISSNPSSMAAVSGSYESPEKLKKSFFSFLLRKSETNSTPPPPTSDARASTDTNFVPLLEDIAEVASISSVGVIPEVMAAAKAPNIRVRAPTVTARPRILPIRKPEYQVRKASVALRVEDDEVFDNPPPVVAHRERRRSSSSIYSLHELQVFSLPRKSTSTYDEELSDGLGIRRTSSVYDSRDGLQPGDDPSPPLSPPLSPARRYSESHMSHPDVYIPPRANWYKAEWGLDDGTVHEADRISVTAHTVGAVKAIVSRQSSRRGSLEEALAIGNKGRKRNEDERMVDLSKALRESLKMNDVVEEEEEEDGQYC
ncbi:hypothetical protein H072_3244 [Dactylellina haptotyla CBS 200.50]|uniref:Uncharacterized protein n=1 Tax=Dactylellina haptotyla (strain CBS 200.50) TaxID=1284197 RepID=S8AIC7_DACHA|nr:hypothetical protein H072_3244 [Dactylellina haptotyla CBS 200.50]